MFDGYNDARKAILSTILQLITKKKFQATSISLISKESGISTGFILFMLYSRNDGNNKLWFHSVCS